MPLPWALRGLRNGVVTTKWPHRPDDYFDTFPATVKVEHTERAHEVGASLAIQSVLDEICPTGALQATSATLGHGVVVDTGRCIGCGRCVLAAPDLFSWRLGADVSRLSRNALTARTGHHEDHEVEWVRTELAHRVRRLKRSVHIRHIDVGSDGSDEWEVQALLNPVYDVHRLGIFFTASPRHADILLVTGVGAPGMQAPLQRTREAMPDPVVVIATGTDAVSGGIFREGYGSAGGVGDLIDVDVWIPGSPASPFSILHGILLALDQLPKSAETKGRPPKDGHSQGPHDEDQDSGRPR
jgi:Ni,Fe-hydrogenase III small subunit/ferredoxin